MPEVGDIVTIDLDELFDITGGDRVLPSIEDGGEVWWRYLDDDDEGAFCLYTYNEPEIEGDLDAQILQLEEEYKLYPSMFGASMASVIAITDDGNVLCRMQTSQPDSLYTQDGLYIPDFLLTPDEFEVVAR